MTDKVVFLMDYRGQWTRENYYTAGTVAEFDPYTAAKLVEDGRVRYLHLAEQAPETPQPEVAEAEESALDAWVAAALPDDLTAVKGIGPATERALYDIGIYTYRQLVDADPAEIDARLDGVLRYINVDKVVAWQKAAKELV